MLLISEERRERKEGDAISHGLTYEEEEGEWVLSNKKD